MAKSLQYHVLAKARSLIGDPENWCSGRYAVGRTGRTVASGSSRAVKHCAVSAIVFAARQTVANKRRADRIADTILLALAPFKTDPRGAEKYVWSINDHCGHGAVIELFDSALIAR